MQFLKAKAKRSQPQDVTLTMEAGNVEKGLPPVQHEDVVEQRHVIDAELERRVVRKTDRNLVPLVMALCTLHRTCNTTCS